MHLQDKFTCICDAAKEYKRGHDKKLFEIAKSLYEKLSQSDQYRRYQDIVAAFPKFKSQVLRPPSATPREWLGLPNSEKTKEGLMSSLNE